MSFVPLNIKTGNYLLTSMIKIKDLVKVAKENNLEALTITDNNMYGVLDFYRECKNNGIKPIIGLEVTIDFAKFVLYAMNYDGYKNLIKITTLMSENIALEELSVLSDNLICIVPYTSRKLYNDLKKIYEYIFIGYKDELEKEKIKSSNKVYMNEILCLEKNDEKYLKYLYAIKEGKTIKESIDFKDVSLLPILDLKEENNEKIYDLCNLEIKFHNDLIPIVSSDAYDILKQKCMDGMRSVFGKTAPKKYIERLKYELKIINDMGFCNYFLIVEDYVRYAKDNNILVGPGRGSAAGSLVSYLLNITTIDPIRYDLLFERFLNPERITMPDIDIDFEDLRRAEVINYCTLKYGSKRVAPIITFSTLGPRQVIKDIGRVLEVDSKKIDNLSKMLDPKQSLVVNYKEKRINNYLENNQELKMVYKLGLKFEGLKRQTSIHAAGIVMARCDLDEIIPLDKHHDFYTTGYDMTYLEEIGLLKMDFLGITNLNLISNILNEIGNLTFDSIPLDDKKTIELFKKGDTKGIFQFEKDGMINFLKKLKVSCLDDIIAAIALYRPGPMQNIDSYIRRKEGKEKVNYIHPDLEGILKSTYGIIIYQEQIMLIARLIASYSFAEADILRGAMSKKKADVLLAERTKFINNCVKNGYALDIANNIYDLILKFASYGFNKSHSVGYAIVAYKMAYLKANYRTLFLKHLLSSSINSSSKTMEYISECKKNKINIILPDINHSMDNYIIYKGDILYPINNLKGISTEATRQIIKEREKGFFSDIFDFVRRTYKKAVTIKVIQNLILSGAFDRLGYNRKTLICNLQVILNYGELGEYLDEGVFKPELEIKEEYTKKELMNFELEVFGFYVSNHPIQEYRLKFPKAIELKDVNSYFDKIITTIIYVVRTNTIKTKKDDKMMFITGMDEINKIDVVLFPKTYDKYSNVKEGDIILINGKVTKRFDKMQIVANEIKKLN